MNGKNKAVKKERTPLGVPRQRLAVNSKAGYKRRWINDRDDRINKAIEGGYSLVEREDADFTDKDTANRNDSLDNSMSKVVNSDGSKAYLMEIPIVHFTADQNEKQKMIDQTENALRHGEDTHGRPGAGGRYIPREGIKIGVK